MTSRPTAVDRLDRLPHRLLVPAGLVVAAALAISSLHGDSVTFDEPFILTAGASALGTGDHRLVDAHPPLVGIWAALPLNLSTPRMWSVRSRGWRAGDLPSLARSWFFDLNHGQDLVIPGRYMIVLLLLGTCLCIYALARQLFGRTAGILALFVAALSPNLLAHGRLVTTDIPVTFLTSLTLLLFSRLMARITWARLATTALSFAALSLVKFSWLVILPALLAVTIHTALRAAPLGVATGRPWRRGQPRERELAAPRQRLLPLLGCWLVIALVVWSAIWTCYRWRYHALPAAARQAVHAGQAGAPPTRTRFSEAGWRRAMNDEAGKPRTGPLHAFVRLARATRILPEAYLHSMVFLGQSASGRASYLLGETSDTGWRSYFLVAFVLKTPVPTMALLLLGLGAMLWRRPARAGAAGLLLGMGVYAAVYLGLVILSRVNIGLRYILPLYPIAIVAASASAAWLRSPPATSLPAPTIRWTVGGLLAWLIAATLWIHPHYLSYFNELAGGPESGHRYLADSNLDWGQDLLRLRRYAREHPGEEINLSYFGSADPARYGCRCRSLPSSFGFGEPSSLGAGTYVVSATHLLGVYKEMARDSFWRDPKNVALLRRIRNLARQPLSGEASPRLRQRRRRARQELSRARRHILLARLRRRKADRRIGHSLFVFRLTRQEVDRLSAL